MIVHVFRYLSVLRSPSPAGSHSRRACQERDWWQRATRGADQTYSYHAVSNSPVTNAGPCRFIQETISRLLMEIDAECGNSRWKSVGLWWTNGLDSTWIFDSGNDLPGGIPHCRQIYRAAQFVWTAIDDWKHHMASSLWVTWSIP